MNQDGENKMMVEGSRYTIKGSCLDQFLAYPIEQLIDVKKRNYENPDRDVILIETCDPIDK